MISTLFPSDSRVVLIVSSAWGASSLTFELQPMLIIESNKTVSNIRPLMRIELDTCCWFIISALCVFVLYKNKIPIKKN